MPLLTACLIVGLLLLLNPQSSDDSPNHRLKDRLLDRFLENGYVVSRSGDEAKHLGDSLLWSSLALAFLDCSEGEVILKAIEDSVRKRNGALVRIEPLPREYIDRHSETSRDQVVGAMFGLVYRGHRCPQDRARLNKLWQSHAQLVHEHWFHLYPGGYDTQALKPVSGYTWNAVSEYFGAKTIDLYRNQQAFKTALLSATELINKQQSACYPIHTTTLQLMTLDTLGHTIVDQVKSDFCQLTEGMRLGLTDFYCGRDPLWFFDEFHLNAFEYRHQRCYWEGTDGENHIETPAIDYLLLDFLMRDAKHLKQNPSVNPY